MFDLNPFRLSGCARSIDNISQVICCSVASRILCNFLSNSFPILIETDYKRNSEGGMVSFECRMSQKNRYLSIFQHETKALRRIAGVKWYIGSSCFKDA